MGFRKTIRGAKKYVKKRYNVGGKKQLRNINSAAIVDDVMKLMAMVNAEKKSDEQSILTFNVGQVNANVGTGAICQDITPMMAEGADQFQRNGISVKLHSMFIQAQISQQSSGTIANSLILELWYQNGHTEDQTAALNNIYLPSIFSGVIDSTSTRNPDHMSDYTRFFQRKITLPYDQVSGVSTTKTLSFPIKFNKGKGRHIRYTGSGSTNYLTDVQNGQILLILRAENGNQNATTASTAPVVVTAANTGILMRTSWKTWFYDN